ncbi:MAG TPA: hypothetical protein VGW12_19060 [Pyrinomonadaceae bacterium]|nr:hypothetical protein [Pyrinomonadaceae bacterium]
MTLAQFMLPGETVLFRAAGEVYYRRLAYDFYVTGERVLLHAVTGRLAPKERVIAEILADIRLLEYSERGLFAARGKLDIGFLGNTMSLTGEPETIKGVWRALQSHTLKPSVAAGDNEVTLVVPPEPLFDDVSHPPVQVEPLSNSLYRKPSRGLRRMSIVAAACLFALAAVVFLLVSRVYRRDTPPAQAQLTAVSTPFTTPTPAPTPISVRVMDETFTLEEGSHRAVNFTVPVGVSAPRVSGGFRVTSGSFVDFYVMNETQFSRFATGEPPDVTSTVYRVAQWNARVGERLSPGTYYLVFDARDAGVGAQTVAAEFFVVYDRDGNALPAS